MRQASPGDRSPRKAPGPVSLPTSAKPVAKKTAFGSSAPARSSSKIARTPSPAKLVQSPSVPQPAPTSQERTPSPYVPRGGADLKQASSRSSTKSPTHVQHQSLSYTQGLASTSSSFRSLLRSPQESVDAVSQAAVLQSLRRAHEEDLAWHSKNSNLHNQKLVQVIQQQEAEKQAHKWRIAQFETLPSPPLPPSRPPPPSPSRTIALTLASVETEGARAIQGSQGNTLEQDSMPHHLAQPDQQQIERSSWSEFAHQQQIEGARSGNTLPQGMTLDTCAAQAVQPEPAHPPPVVSSSNYMDGRGMLLEPVMPLVLAHSGGGGRHTLTAVSPSPPRRMSLSPPGRPMSPRHPRTDPRTDDENKLRERGSVCLREPGTREREKEAILSTQCDPAAPTEREREIDKERWSLIKSAAPKESESERQSPPKPQAAPKEREGGSESGKLLENHEQNFAPPDLSATDSIQEEQESSTSDTLHPDTDPANSQRLRAEVPYTHTHAHKHISMILLLS